MSSFFQRVLFFKIVFGILDPLCFCMNFRISLSIAVKKDKLGF